MTEQVDEENKIPYSLDAAITAAKEELAEMNKMMDVVGPQIYLLAAKHGPHTLEEVGYVLTINTWLYGVPPQPGRLLIDTVRATVAQFITESLFIHQRSIVEEKINQQQEALASKQMLAKKYGKVTPIPKRKKTSS